ncbi:hypothetical protein [Frigoribacterium sp. SL97]|uniref:hypothetical protein n=1 Tax=Frigoribacterium sp. SL97 TaxID=2994664 RepID=UPI002271B1D5|nr:hypothetical protein [Frigoribacterium sp. SL97]WAC53228.1 hypothetical protein OVA02_08375 [Frigoribacterium sp. SL97]
MENGRNRPRSSAPYAPIPGGLWLAPKTSAEHRFCPTQREEAEPVGRAGHHHHRKELTKMMTSKERYEHLIATSESQSSVKAVEERKPGEYEHLSAAVDLVVYELAEFLADYDPESWPSLIAELRAPNDWTERRISDFSKRHAERARMASFKPWVPRILVPAEEFARMAIHHRSTGAA